MRLLSIVFTLLLVTNSSQLNAEEATGDERYQKVGEHIIFDAQTGLMWAAQDNGKDVDWFEADDYCAEFEAGGYDDWRMPDIKELASLYTKDQKNKEGFHITKYITITDCCVWSSETNMGGATIFSYKSGKKPDGFQTDTYQLRALPVRNSTKKGSDDYNLVDRSGSEER